jgi:nucleotide-binding universal stress UspA family protein
MTAFDDPSSALGMAIGLAETRDAHLEVMCLGLDRVQATYYELGSNAMVMQAAIEEAHRRAESINAGVSEYLESTAIRWDVVNGIGSIDGVGRTIAARARFADLAVLDLPYGGNSRAEDSLVLEGLLFDAGCPTIVVPEGKAKATPDSIVIAWNEGPEALRAVRAALPFLQAASQVHIAIVDPPEHGPERSDPGGALAVFLSRHGVTADIQVMSSSGARVSERIARHVTESGSDMLVMGAYGHSRFREAILGGATRDMLEHSKVPILMAH